MSTKNKKQEHKPVLRIILAVVDGDLEKHYALRKSIPKTKTGNQSWNTARKNRKNQTKIVRNQNRPPKKQTRQPKTTKGNQTPTSSSSSSSSSSYMTGFWKNLKKLSVFSTFLTVRVSPLLDPPRLIFLRVTFSHKFLPDFHSIGVPSTPSRSGSPCSRKQKGGRAGNKTKSQWKRKKKTQENITKNVCELFFIYCKPQY